jgi:hypothetical protein
VIKLSIIPIPSITLMYTTLYHMCKLWWYTINLRLSDLSYWSTVKEP